MGERLAVEGAKGNALALIYSGEIALSAATHGAPVTASAASATRPGAAAAGGSGANGGRTPRPRSASPPTATARGSAADGAAAAAAAASASYAQDGGGGGGKAPREMPLCQRGPGQMLPCLPSATGLLDGIVYPATARVCSARAQVVLLDCRFITLVLSKQDNGRALEG